MTEVPEHLHQLINEPVRTAHEEALRDALCAELGLAIPQSTAPGTSFGDVMDAGLQLRRTLATICGITVDAAPNLSELELARLDPADLAELEELELDRLMCSPIWYPLWRDLDRVVDAFVRYRLEGPIHPPE